MSKKISDLDAVAGATAAAGTTVVIEISVDGVSKKMTKAETLQFLASLWAGSTALGGSGVHATQDKIPIADNAVGKHILVTELQIAMFALATAITTGFHATQDSLLYDDNGVAKKVTIPNLLVALLNLNTTTLAGSGVAGGDQLAINDGTLGSGVPKSITVTELITAISLLGLTLADIPEYADQAAAQAALTGTGKLFRFATTGALGLTIA